MLLNFGVGEDSWESLGVKETQPVNPKGKQSWIFTRRTDAEASILWPPDTKSWFIGKDADGGIDWRQEEKGATEDEMVGWHHWLDEHEFEPTLGDSGGQGGLVCCSPWGHKESDTTERLNNSMIYKPNADKYQKTDNAEPWAVGGRKLTCSEVWYREGGMASYDGLLSWRKQRLYFRKAEARKEFWKGRYYAERELLQSVWRCHWVFAEYATVCGESESPGSSVKSDQRIVV